MHQSILLKILLLNLAIHTLQAADFCVTSPQEFQNALYTAQNNLENDVVRITAGEYLGGFNFSSSESYNLTITGGWQGSNNNPCGTQITDPLATKLNENDNRDILRMTTSADSNVLISNLSISDFSNNNFGAGIQIRQDSNNNAPETGTVTIERLAFINNTTNSAVLDILDNRQIIIRNSFFINNTGSLIIDLFHEGNRNIYINNNTVIDNSAGNNAIDILMSGNADILVANNLMWNNQMENYDLRIYSLSGNGVSYFYNNNLQNPTPQTYDHEMGNLSIQPIFQNGNTNYMPALNSVEFNGGITADTIMPNPPPFPIDWQPGTLDFNGNTRIQYGTIDIGAIETIETVIFKNGFDS